MIIIVDAVPGGGIVQFSMRVKQAFENNNMEVKLLVPQGVEYDSNEKNVVEYRKVKSMNMNNSALNGLVQQVMSYNPELVIFTDDGLVTSQLLIKLSGKVKTLLTVHDPTPHPTNKGIVFKLRYYMKRYFVLKAYKKASNILLLSDNSKNTYIKYYGQYRDKCVVMKLGAHVPICNEEKPSELNGLTDNYYLFFGRIDKYKGIENLVRAYESLDTNKPLVIAGNGILSETEQRLINKNNNVILIKRFIKDSEMIWLMKNALCVVLPYVEASQSGVLPISYHFDKPVIVTDLDGLTEFVDKDKTGYIVKDINELKNAMKDIEAAAEIMIEEIKKYYELHFNWEKNVKLLIEQL